MQPVSGKLPQALGRAKETVHFLISRYYIIDKDLAMLWLDQVCLGGHALPYVINTAFLPSFTPFQVFLAFLQTLGLRSFFIFFSCFSNLLPVNNRNNRNHHNLEENLIAD